MSNYSSLKATINANVKANGNQEITGPVMNSVLNAMVDSLGAGYQYMGKAVPSTNPGTPDAKVFYLASDPGTYTNFNGLVVADGEVAFLKWDSAWSKEVTGAATAAQLTQLGQKIIALRNEVFNVTQSSETITHQKVTYRTIDQSTHNLVYYNDKYATLYYIPVTKGEYININVVFPSARPIRYGVFASMNQGESCLQFFTDVNSQEYQNTFRVRYDGYLAMYIYDSSTFSPTSFSYKRISYVYGTSRIADLEASMDSVQDSLGTKIYSELTPVSGMYINETTGVVTAFSGDDDQKGFYGAVRTGQHVYVDIQLPSSWKVRYGFLSSVPAIGDVASNPGAVNGSSSYRLEFDVQSDGFFMATVYGGMTSMALYIKDGMTMEDVTERLDDQQENIDELMVGLEKFKKPSFVSVFSLPLSGTGSANSLSQGQYLETAIGVYSDDDMAGFKFTPVGSTFDIRFGKFAATGGTLFSLQKSSGQSNVCVFSINASGTPVLVKTEQLPFELLENVEYYVRYEKYVYNNIIFNLTITSNAGQYYSTSVGRIAGRGWGKYYLLANTGSVRNISISEFSAYKLECRLMFVGHSYVEGISTEGFSENKFTKMMQEELGYKECAIMGMGGDTIAGVVTKFSGYVDTLLYRPKYAAIVAGANDTSASSSSMISSLQSFIAKCDANGIVPILFTINPRYDVNNPNWGAVNTWIRESGELYVDMYYCFVDQNGNPIADHYLDNIHPTEQVHAAIFNRMIEDVPEVLNEQ